MIYVAGALFTQAERDFNAVLAAKLRAKGYEVYLPQETSVGPGPDRTRRIFRNDVDHVSRCQAVVAVCEYQQIDDGTAWEMGYAAALGKKIFALRTDERVVKPDEQINLMIEMSLTAKPFADVDSLVEAVSRAIPLA